jgi:uncharacterized membrane protein
MAFFFGLLAIALLLGPWIVAWMLHQRLREQARNVEQRFGSVIQRLYELESLVRKPDRATASTAPDTAPAPAEPGSASTAVVESRQIEPEQPVKTVALTPPLLVPPRAIEVPARPTAPPVTPRRPPNVAQKKPNVGPREETPTLVDQIRDSGGLEDLLGKNWLNKLGIVLLVMGVAFFLAFQLKTMGPAGKVLVGFLTSLALLGAGIWTERLERYRILGRAGIGGGWALLFFTTYAMYHVPAAQVLTSQLLDLVLMLAVALAMVAHTLRYNSQVVTGLAFLLAYLTIFVSRVSVYSLTAGVVLALGIALIVVRRRWFELEVFGILATYLNHYVWLHSILEPMGDNRQSFAEFIPSAAILASYWLIYRVSYLWRRIENADEENISTLAALLNTGFLLGLLRYQSAHPEWAFWALVVLGAAEMALSQLPIAKSRRTAFVVLATIGATLLVAAIPFRYSGSNVSVLWIMESEALFLVGIWSSEVVFTRLGLVAGIATAGQMLGVDAFRVLIDRIGRTNLAPDYGVGLLVVGLGAIVLYNNAHVLSRRWKDLFAAGLDRQLLRLTSYVAAVLATVALWMAFPDVWTAVSWGVLGLTLAILARRYGWGDLAVQANVISAAALIRVLVVNLSSTSEFHGVSLRLVSVALVAGLYYLTAHWTGVAPETKATTLSAVYTWTASTLVFLLVWYEAEPIYIALLWCMFGMVLYQIGIRNRGAALRWQGCAVLAASFFRMLLFNLANGPHPAEVSARVYAVIPIAIVGYYVFSQGTELPSDSERHIATLYAWMGTATIVALAWYETDPDWLAVSWAGITFLLLATAFLLQNPVFTQQAVVFSFAVLLYAVLHNLDGLVPGWSARGLAVAAASAILLVSLYFCFRLRKVEASEGGRPAELNANSLFDRPEQTLFFVPLLMITLLLALEMRSGLITISWGVEAVLVFLFALLVNERSYRLSGLALLLLCVGKIVVVDVWGLNPRDRYITFIIMGCALLLVSFLYTRHRDTIKQYL